MKIYCSKDDIRTYQNRRNENKFIETKQYDDGHKYARQYMKWDTPYGEVKNYSGSKSNRGRYHRVSQRSPDQMLEDYDDITKIYEAKYLDSAGDYRYHYIYAPDRAAAVKLAEKIKSANDYRRAIYVASV